MSAGVVNATPVGMLGIPGDPFPARTHNSRPLGGDVIYTPLEPD